MSGRNPIEPPVAADPTIQAANLRKLDNIVDRFGWADDALGPELTACLDASFAAFIVANGESRIRFFNRAAERLLGWSAGEVLGEPIERIIPERYRVSHAVAVAEANRTEGFSMNGAIRRVEALGKDGTEISIELSLSSWRKRGQTFIIAGLRPYEAAHAAGP